MYRTFEVLLCDTCEVRLTHEIALDFGMANMQAMEKLSRIAVELGWLYVPSDATPGKKSQPSRHYCPACKMKVRTPYPG